MKYLVDTNVISEVRKGDRCNLRVASWFATVADDDIYLSVLVLGEVRKGVERARRSNLVQAKLLETWLDELRNSFGDRLLPVDQPVADEWGRMSAGRSVPTVDGLLAATAKVHRMTLATRNIADVADLGANTINPFG